MDDLISRQYLAKHIHACMENDRLMQTATKEEILQMVADTPSVQPDKDMIHLQKEQAYMQGWEAGREALREEIWEDGRDRLD